jgi:hypothetical protein
MSTTKEVEDYMKARAHQTPEEREKCFHAIAPSLGQVDASTHQFRKACKDTGFRVVFRSGLSRKQTLDVLRSQSAQKILASHA